MTNKERPLIGRVIIQGVMKCETGLHVGTSQETLEIGRTDLLVQREPMTKEPYIPGSSLKGKLRCLLERIKQKDNPKEYSFNRYRDSISRHECNDRLYPKPNPETGGKGAVNCEVCRIFGSTGDKGGKNHPARLIVRDLHFTSTTHNKLEEIESDLLYTERKFENTIDRITSAATPRQIERIPAGSEFFFEIIYAVEDRKTVTVDLKNIFSALSALELDALGGFGSRGYGKVSFKVVEFKSLNPDEPRKLSFSQLKELAYEEEDSGPRAGAPLMTLEEITEDRIKDVSSFFQERPLEEQSPMSQPSN